MQYSLTCMTLDKLIQIKSHIIYGIHNGTMVISNNNKDNNIYFILKLFVFNIYKF